MTESEAREKWCPFARLSWHRENHEEINMNGYNRVVDDSSEGPAAIKAAKCIASDCMAWRWETMRLKEHKDGTASMEPDDGCCGLAGKP